MGETYLDAVGFTIWAVLLMGFPVWLGLYFTYEIVKFFASGRRPRDLEAVTAPAGEEVMVEGIDIPDRRAA